MKAAPGEFLANTVCGPGRVLRQQESQLHLQIYLLIVYDADRDGICLRSGE